MKSAEDWAAELERRNFRTEGKPRRATVEVIAAAQADAAAAEQTRLLLWLIENNWRAAAHDLRRALARDARVTP